MEKTIQLSNKDFSMLKLKSIAFEKGDINELIRKAIVAYKPKESFDIIEKCYLFIDGKEIAIKKVPGIKKGNEVYEDILLLSEIEKYLTEYKQNIPDSIYFNELFYF